MTPFISNGAIPTCSRSEFGSLNLYYRRTKHFSYIFSQKHRLLALLLINNLPLSHSGQVGEESCQTKNRIAGKPSSGHGTLHRAHGCVGEALPFGKLGFMNSNPQQPKFSSLEEQAKLKRTTFPNAKGSNHYFLNDTRIA